MSRGAEIRLIILGIIFIALILFVVIMAVITESPEVKAKSTPESELVIELTIIPLEPAPSPSIVERLEEADANSLLMQKILRIERLLEALLDRQCEEVSEEIPDQGPSNIQIKMMEDYDD